MTKPARAGGSAAGPPAGPTLSPDRRRRDYAALLEVARDDARRLAAREGRPGLAAKVRSALGVLPLTARVFLQDRPGLAARTAATLRSARRAGAGGDWDTVVETLTPLTRTWPLALQGLTPPAAGADQVRWARRAYEAQCAACHGGPGAGSAPAAPNLFRWARRLPARDFVARMIDGIHGTASVSFANPLSDSQIAGLYAYLRRRAGTGEQGNGGPVRARR
ncbi:MAG TPA: cytochrome c [Gammaproteobacteria bacterium]|nr:cytochrome c [Gammaproteobacteria bacterium]